MTPMLSYQIIIILFFQKTKKEEIHFAHFRKLDIGLQSSGRDGEFKSVDRRFLQHLLFLLPHSPV